MFIYCIFPGGSDDEESTSNAGVCCVGLSWSVLSDSTTPWTVCSLHTPLSMDSPGKNTGVHCHSLLQGIFLSQELNRSLLHCRQIFTSLTTRGAQCRRPRFNPLVQKVPWRREWQPTPVFLPGKAHEQENLVVYSPRGCEESDMTQRLAHIFLSLNFITQ